MKKTVLFLIAVFAFCTASAQDDMAKNEKKNEVKFNVLLPAFGKLEGTYERFLNTNSSVGISGLYVFNDNNSKEDMNFMFSPFYRRYFGKKYASGFFVEGFGALSSIDGKKVYDTPDHTTFTRGDAVLDLSLGLGLGSKWETKNGFTFEVNANYGQLLFNTNKTKHDHVVRFGAHVGYKF